MGTSRAGSRRELSRRGAAGCVAAALLLASCGLPGSGQVRTVDDDEVPYRLLESDTPAPPAATGGPAPAKAPAVFWASGERLLPEPTGDTCAEDPGLLVERLLDTLAAGPSEEARAAGRWSAVPTDFGLEVVGISDGTVEVGVEPETSLSAEQLPIAVGQVVLTVTSAPAVDSVVLVDDGEPVQVPLPAGVLAEGPVTAGDYLELLPARFRAPGAIGCPRP